MRIAVWAPYGGRGGPRGLDLGDIAAIRLYGALPYRSARDKNFTKEIQRKVFVFKRVFLVLLDLTKGILVKSICILR